jgi:hypothetical protein
MRAANISVFHQRMNNFKELSMFKAVNPQLTGRNLWHFMDPVDT